MLSLRVHAALFAVALLFSINYVISKVGMRELSPMSFAWLRIAAAAAILSVIVRGSEPLSRDDQRAITKLSILGVVINAPLFLAGLALTTVHVAAVLITSIPVFATGAAIALGHERASARRIGGIALAGAGALLIVAGESLGGGWRALIGTLMLLTNCLSYSLYLVLSKPLLQRVPARQVVTRMFATGTLLLFPIAAWWLFRQDWRGVSSGSWLALAFVIAGPTIGAYLLNAWTLRHADSSFVAAYTYLQPLLASFLGWMFLGEQIRGIVIAAAAMIFAGLWLAGRSSM